MKTKLCVYGSPDGLPIVGDTFDTDSSKTYLPSEPRDLCGMTGDILSAIVTTIDDFPKMHRLIKENSGKKVKPIATDRSTTREWSVYKMDNSYLSILKTEKDNADIIVAAEVDALDSREELRPLPADARYITQAKTYLTCKEEGSLQDKPAVYQAMHDIEAWGNHQYQNMSITEIAHQLGDAYSQSVVYSAARSLTTFYGTTRPKARWARNAAKQEREYARQLVQFVDDHSDFRKILASRK